MSKNILTTKKENGIVLLEAVIAVGVLVTIFAATIALYVGSVGGLRITNDQLIATYLAQDGMEQIIAKRQYNYDHNEDWLEGMLDGTTNCDATTPCSIDYFNSAKTLADPLEVCVLDCVLYLKNGEYSIDSTGTAVISYFRRSVEFNTLANGFETEVTVRVSWIDGSKILEVPVTFVLYDNPN